jgi:hypothetical protein
MAFKYSQHLAQRAQPCPNPERFRPRNRIAFRFLRKPATEDDFVPKVIADDEAPQENHLCEHFALSFYSSRELALRRYASLAQRTDAAERYGDQIGMIELRTTDGLMSEPHPRNGHLSLHPEEGVTFAHRVTAYWDAAPRAPGDEGGGENAA